MSPHDTSTAGDDARSRADRVPPTIENRSRDGSLATAAGGAMLLWAATRLRESARKAALPALAGVALIGIGWRQRRGGQGEDAHDAGVEVSLEDDEERVSDDAHVEATQDLGAGRVADESRASGESETEPNPRGTAGGDDVQERDAGNFEFVDGREPGTDEEPHLDDEQDPRLDDEGGAEREDESTEIDLSDTATADEASEAAGPQPEQAFPASEGTDPEPQAERAPPRDNEQAVSSADSSPDESAGDEESHNGDDESTEMNDESTEASDESTEASDDPATTGDDSEEST